MEGALTWSDWAVGARNEYESSGIGFYLAVSLL
jgi:hypothetical protein